VRLSRSRRIFGEDLDPVLGDDDRVRVAEAADGRVVEARLDREHHSGLERRRVADVEERRLVVAQADRVARVLAPVVDEIVLLEVAHDGAVDVGAGDPRSDRPERDVLGADGVVEEPPHLVGGRSDDQGALELGVVAPDRRARLRHEHVALLEADVVRDRMGPGAAEPDLPAIPGRHARGGRETPAVAVSELFEHRERRLVARAQAGLGLGRAGTRIPLQEPVSVGAPATALPDERDLRLALARHHRLDDVAERCHARVRDSAQCRPLVPEDPRVAVFVRADSAGGPEIRENAREDRHRVLGSGVLGIRLDACEGPLGERPLDLELRDEHRGLAADALRVHDGPLGREEPEPGEVLDLVRAEEDVAR
jgi:hypothetical protein